MKYWQAESLSKITAVKHAFFGRVGGVSPGAFKSLNVSYAVGDVSDRVLENRSRVQRCFSDDAKLYSVKQVHGINVQRISDSDNLEDLSSVEADAVYTTDKNVILGIQTADCAPVLICSKNGHAIAAVHAGWRGAVAGIVENMVATLSSKLNLEPDNLVAAVGPCIGVGHYEVGAEVEAKLSESERQDCLRTTLDAKYLDLEKLVSKRLLKAGVKDVGLLNICTYGNPSTFFSHRRDKGRTGRQFSTIMMKSQ